MEVGECVPNFRAYILPIGLERRIWRRCRTVDPFCRRKPEHTTKKPLVGAAFQQDCAMRILGDIGDALTDRLGGPFARYALLQGGMLLLAALLGGWVGLGLFVFQAFVAIWQLELVNYIEHYGLTRKHLGADKYEHVKPRHSWNASQQASNWLLINLQRHSDHHYTPDRRFPLLQSYTELDAPQLPYGYPVMTMAAMVPPLFRRIMNPRVRKWRAMYYPEITDWRPYKTASLPMPR